MAGRRVQRRLEQSTIKKTMTFQLHGARFSLWRQRRKYKRRFVDLVLKFGIYTIAAKEMSRQRFGLKHFEQPRFAVCDAHLFGQSFQRATHLRDHETFALRVTFFMRCRFHLQHVTGIFDDHVLKSTTKTQQGKIIFAGPANGVVHGIVVVVG